MGEYNNAGAQKHITDLYWFIIWYVKNNGPVLWYCKRFGLLLEHGLQIHNHHPWIWYLINILKTLKCFSEKTSNLFDSNKRGLSIIQSVQEY